MELLVLLAENVLIKIAMQINHEHKLLAVSRILDFPRHDLSCRFCSTKSWLREYRHNSYLHFNQTPCKLENGNTYYNACLPLPCHI